MKFAIITHVLHGRDKDRYFAYDPYVREMNIWTKYATEVIIVAPLGSQLKTDIDSDYSHGKIIFKAIKSFNLLSVSSALRAIFGLPVLLAAIFKAMKAADHIHLRCPGNIGLLGCFVQIAFPRKPKTAKYAGNWDPKAKQPFSYKLQKWLLSNTYLTRNMTVLVYGEWEGQTENVRAFFTASYQESEKEAIAARLPESDIQMLFVGSLSPGKQPMYAIKLLEKLRSSGVSAQLSMYGNGKEMGKLVSYVKDNGLIDQVTFFGNQTKEKVLQAYKRSHFLILPSKSEGWPKVVAEAMFWKCVPLATAVSCVRYMLGNGSRGIVLSVDLDADCQNILTLLNDPAKYSEIADSSSQWSRQFTLDVFDLEIKKILAK